MNPYSLLGFAQAAGKLASGDEAAGAQLRRGRARLVILAEDAAANTCQRFEGLAARRGVPSLRFGSKEKLGASMGKAPRAVVVVTDLHFARSLQAAMGNARSPAGARSVRERGGAQRS